MEFWQTNSTFSLKVFAVEKQLNRTGWNVIDASEGYTIMAKMLQNSAAMKNPTTGFQRYSAARFKGEKMMKSEAKNFVFGTTARAIRLQEICYCEATSALMRYYISLRADA